MMRIMYFINLQKMSMGRVSIQREWIFFVLNRYGFEIFFLFSYVSIKIINYRVSLGSNSPAFAVFQPVVFYQEK